MNVTKVLLLGLLAAGGCVARPPWPDPQGVAGAAVAVEEAIQIQLVAGPVDVEPVVGDRLSLSQAVCDVLRHSPEVQIALARVRAAQAEAHQARLLPNPIVSVVLRWPESGGSPVIEAGLTAELLSLVSMPRQIRAADDRLRMAGAEAVEVVLDVLAELQNRYVEVQALDALRPVLEERSRLLDQMHDVAQNRLRAGEGTRLDVTTIEAQRVELEVELAECDLERREARLALARLMGRPSDAAEWQVETWEAPDENVGDEESWLTAAMKHRPEIQAVQWELLALGTDAKLAGLAWLDGGEVGVDAERDGDWSAGPSLSVPLPIFDWGQARRRGIEAQRLEALHRLASVHRQVIEEVRRAYASFVASRRAWVRVREQLLPLLDRRRQDAESVYRAGQSDVTTLILAQQEFQAGRVRLIELERRTSESLIRLHRAVGGAGHSPAPLAAGESTP